MITKYKLFEAKQTKEESIKIFLKSFYKYNESKLSYYIYLPCKVPSEIKEEAEMLSYFYMHHTQYLGWHQAFKYSESDITISTFKTRIKKYIGDRIIKKWNKDINIFTDIEKLNIIKDYENEYSQDQETKMIAVFFSRLIKKSVKGIKQRKFNL
jgi:hypothetical protein